MRAQAEFMSRYLCRRSRFSIIALPIGRRVREPVQPQEEKRETETEKEREIRVQRTQGP